MAAFLGSMGTDWLLKRAFKFMLKRNLGCLLRNEVNYFILGSLRTMFLCLHSDTCGKVAPNVLGLLFDR